MVWSFVGVAVVGTRCCPDHRVPLATVAYTFVVVLCASTRLV